MTREELLETYLKPTDLTVKELIDRNALSQIMQFAEAYRLEQLRTVDVNGGYFKILDKYGIEIPDLYSGRRRTYEEVKKKVDSLNKNGEFRPYTMVEV